MKSQKSQELLDERAELEGQLASAQFMLVNIGKALEEDGQTIAAHLQAKVEIACQVERYRTLIERIDGDLLELVEARSKEHEQINESTARPTQ
jgi:hypothetical protein